MKKKKNKLVWVILALVAVFAGMIYFYMNPASSAANEEEETSSSTTTQEVTAGTMTITKSITSSRRNIYC